MSKLLDQLSDRFYGGISLLVCGPPGTGKSTLLGSVLSHGKTLLIALRPNEVNSYGYRSLPKDQITLIYDRGWKPDLDKFVASGFHELMVLLYELQEDETYDFVLLDPLTDAFVLAQHEIMAKEKSPTFQDMGNSMGAYGALRHKSIALGKAVTDLQFAKKPKHVLAAIHTQPAKEDEKGHATVTYSGEVLPAIEGSYRELIAGEFDIVLHTTISRSFKEGTSYGVEVVTNAKRHNKIRLAPALEVKTLPNDFGKVMKVILEAK